MQLEIDVLFHDRDGIIAKLTAARDRIEDLVQDVQQLKTQPTEGQVSNSGGGPCPPPSPPAAAQPEAVVTGSSSSSNLTTAATTTNEDLVDTSIPNGPESSLPLYSMYEELTDLVL